jgi:hypothetical protein
MDNFAREFRTSSQLRVAFENDHFPVWMLGLEGTLAVSGAFQNCMRGLQ